ncbi:MAG TPA: carbohydrate ABC transporter permease [Candidatus Faecaligallichristensenella faecipullorum]|nr:carbohydrate ABC transporter permease [Candidatus Faecaligallichristensenella faecipullorum]
MIKESMGRRAFYGINAVVLFLIAVICLVPILHVIALSFSGSSAVMAGQVTLWPVKPTLASYNILMQRSDFFDSFKMSLFRVLLGTAVNLVLIMLTAYPLSKNKNQFHGRTVYAWYLIITIIFSGGLIPTYMVVRQMGLINSIWALILPGAVPVWNTVLMMNFYRNLPREIEESAFIDGADHLVVLIKLYVPLSAPAVATVALFSIVGHWNSWFDGLIYLNTPSMYPLQTFLYMIGTAVTQGSTTTENVEYMREISDRTLRSAQIVIAMVPVLAAYPFLQKYFTKGIVMGSVKG